MSPKPRIVPTTTVPKKTEAVERVIEILDTWADWVADTRRGILTPHQLLALVLWMIRTDQTSHEQEVQIVEGWAQALIQACGRDIPALHPVTLLPLTSPVEPGNWVLSIAHAQEFLDSMPVGFDCCKVLDHFQVQAAEMVNGDAAELTYQQAVEQRKANKRASLTYAQVKAIQRQVAIDGLSAVAEDIGIARQTLSTNLKRALNKPVPLKPNDMFGQLKSA